MKETITFRPSRDNASLLTELEKMAKAENRSLNNYIETVLLAHLKERGQKKNKA